VPKVHAERSISTQKVPHSYSDNGEVCYGDTVQVYNTQTNSVLASNIFAPDSGIRTGEECPVTGSNPGANDGQAQARNTFVITAPDSFDDNKYGDRVVRYGEPFMLSINPSLRLDTKTGLVRTPLFLTSDIVSTERYVAAVQYNV
jgi:hypothetical protein